MYNNIKILAIDPGLSKLGWAVLITRKDKIEVMDTGLIEARKRTNKVQFRELNEKYNNRIVTLSEIEDEIVLLMNKYQPDHVTCEDAFFCSRFASAFAALVQATIVIERVLYKNYQRPLHKIPTKTAKKEICGYGGDSKQPVQEAVNSNKNIKLNKTVGDINEHTADAIAVGYAFYTKILPTLI